MALYAVGDIQGCYEHLSRLLERVNFDPADDILVCVGDLVNRGPESARTLDLVIGMGDRCQVVLGNHDIHFLALHYGVRSPKVNDTLIPLLKHEGANDYAKWLRKQPLLRVDEERKLIFCHAGIYPWWGLDMAQQRAREVEAVFAKRKKCIKLLNKIYSNQPSKWTEDLGPVARMRFSINAFTRMRFVSPKGHLNLTESGYSGRSRKNRLAWFDIANPYIADYKVVFGHWSALGLLNRPNVLCLDTGCVWGRELTMAKIPKNPNKIIKIFQTSSAEAWPIIQSP